MLPNRPLPLDQIGGHTGSTTTTGITSSDNKMKCIARTEQISCTKTEASDDDNNTDATNQFKRKKLDNDEEMDVTPDENELVDTESPPDPLGNDDAMNPANIVSLESFPVEVLEKIFIRTDDATLLLKLTRTCKRFAAIGQMVFSMRYANRYFVVNGERMGGDPDIYAKQLNRSGSSIQAIQINHAEDINGTDWASKLLQSHINHIKKLTFNNCIIKSKNIFSQRLDITHLAYRNDFSFGVPRVFFWCREQIVFPECHQLQKLEVHETYEQKFSASSLYRIIRNNPTLQSLLLYNFSSRGMSLWEILTLIADNLKQIAELALIMDSDWKWERGPHTIDQIFKSFEHLESLTLSVGHDSIEHLKHVGMVCKRIKHLGLLVHGEFADLGSEFDVVVRSFHQIESFHCYQNYFHDIEVIFLSLEKLSKLRHLSIELTHCQYRRIPNVLPLLRKCPALEKVTIIFKYNFDGYPETFVSVQFFEEFIETINITGKPNARIEVKERDRIIGIVTANGIAWRNKLMYWTECDKNDTNINLLDLANHPIDSKKTKRATDQTNLLDRICEYLDLSSLTSLAKTGDRSLGLVESYIKEHSNRFGMFIITDEFRSMNSGHFWIGLDELKYTNYIADLKIYALHNGSKRHICNDIFECFGYYFNKLWVDSR